MTVNIHEVEALVGFGKFPIIVFSVREPKASLFADPYESSYQPQC